MSKFLDWLLGPKHYYQCHFGHQFSFRMKNAARYQWCPDCNENGFDVEAREIKPQEKAHA